MLGIIGGSGLDQLSGLEITERRACATPYGEPSADLVFGTLRGQALVFQVLGVHAHHRMLDRGELLGEHRLRGQGFAVAQGAVNDAGLDRDGDLAVGRRIAKHVQIHDGIDLARSHFAAARSVENVPEVCALAQM